jgi:hypothetical protein
VGIVILVLALSDFYSLLKRKNNLPIWTSTTKVMLLHLATLVVGGVSLLGFTFCLISAIYLLFYGLALVNAGKYTYSDIQYLATSIIYWQFLFFSRIWIGFFGPLVLIYT